MTRHLWQGRLTALLFSGLILMSCEGTPPPGGDPSVGSQDQRAALFDSIIEKTMAREAFSPFKNQALQIDIRAEMLALRDEFVAAGTPDALFHSLVKLSNTRRDRHLTVAPVLGGLRPVAWGDGDGLPPTLMTPVRFAADFSTPGGEFLFVSDLATAIELSSESSTVSTGDRLVSVNGLAFDDYVARMKPYLRHSTEAGFWWKFAERVSERHYTVPDQFYDDVARFGLETSNGSRYEVALPYLNPEEIEWTGLSPRTFEGFSLVKDLETFDLYRHPRHPVLLLDWYGFREHLVSDMDWLMDWAKEAAVLDYSVIFDATRSRGGSRGAYAVQRLSPKPFKTTFGNLRLSDVIPEFILRKQQEFSTQDVNDGGVPEAIDDGTWLLDWLLSDVRAGLDRGDPYSNDVPFKLAHAPRTSDGLLSPAPVHFSGPLVVLLGPHGGSHLDQFASIVVDNKLGTVIGMPAGGYSNTWEWAEVLIFPGTEQPVAGFMWSIGHTIRPNGEILEGNPAQVDELVPLTRENFAEYHSVLIHRALQHLGFSGG